MTAPIPATSAALYDARRLVELLRVAGIATGVWHVDGATAQNATDAVRDAARPSGMLPRMAVVLRESSGAYRLICTPTREAAVEAAERAMKKELGLFGVFDLDLRRMLSTQVKVLLR